MTRIPATLLALAVLAGCGDGQPFFKTDIETLDPEIDPQDPNTDVDSKFAFDLDANLTLNSVRYDSANDELVINNLPFDGPDGRYDFTRIIGANARLYESRQTATTGLVKHYAVFIQGNEVDASAAVGSDWIGFGYGGANLNRDEFDLPADGEYVYLGTYAGLRAFSDRSGLELVNGDVRLLLDINDLDPAGGIQGSIVATVSNRTREPLTGGSSGTLPSLTLARVSFDTDQGTWLEGEASTFDRNGDVRDTGTYEGFLAGPQGQEVGAHVVIEGVAYKEALTYETVNYIVGTELGSVSAYESDQRDAIQAIVDSGGTLGLRTVPDSSLPPGATVTSRTRTTIDFESEFRAREVGVLVTEQQ